MSSDGGEVTLLQTLGESIRLRRKSLGLTLKDVERSTGLSHSFLSKIERGLARPSMRSLTVLANALNTTAHSLMALNSGDDDEVSLIPGATGIEIAHGGGMARALVRGSWPFVPVEFRSGPMEFAEYFVHPGREMIYVAYGHCEMEVAGYGVYELQAGDSLHYGAGLEHRWRQTSRDPICVLLIQENADHGTTHSGDSPRFVEGQQR
ncbi:helix-turn-helix domain-containing protein [Rhodococcus sp. IEGM 248]|uniref:helix-turn-helix domain-containing protein n=1 Tax=Rhodococcus opacus TaxID=37919 RepID=UPI0013C19620|nr:XRE family transcriptional regulator [Rhodococcus opacus]MDV7090179.1 XRE family transcriptional regulator [Rhodococcus opacus]NDV10527.1 helix-turn-helix domain-containing protein [Rhodococcus sp. IEGM 248]